MELMTIIAALRARSFPFRMLQSKLRDEQMHSAVGWDPLLEWYDTTTPDHDKTVTWIDVFTEIYSSHLKYGTKGVVVFTIDRLTALKLIKRISSIMRIPHLTLITRYYLLLMNWKLRLLTQYQHFLKQMILMLIDWLCAPSVLLRIVSYLTLRL
jgi:hypothetical protein